MRSTCFILTVWLFTLVACSSLQTEPTSTHLPRVGVHNHEGNPEFYDKNSGKRFVPQGVNWVRLANTPDKWPANISFDPSYFYSHIQEIQGALKAMGALGFNVVRVRVDGRAITGPKNQVTLNTLYVENLISFIRMANQEGLYVLLTGQWLPENYYQLATAPPNKNASGINQILMSKSLTRAFAQYESDLIRTTKEKDPKLLSGILAFDLWNEQSFSGKDLPFSQESGIFVSDWGKKYDLSDVDSREMLADDAAVLWVNEVTHAIKAVDSEILVTSSVFTPLEVRRTGYHGVYISGSSWGDWRQPFRLTALEKSDLDYLQIHPYPHSTDYKIEADLGSLEFSNLKRTKPVLIGEFGAHKKDFPNIETVVPTMKSLLAQACRHQISGWIYWVWDTYQQNRKDDLWNMTDANDTIAKGLAPKTHNWCSKE